MATKKNINANPRAFHVAIAGNNTEDGFSIETSKATIQATIDAVNSLIPPPNVFNPSSITVSGSGFFTESNLIIPEGCQFIGTGIFNLPSTGNCFEPGSRATFEITTAGLLGGNGTVFLINNKPEIGVQAKACVVRGDGGTGVHVLGTSDIVFITISQLQLEADNAVGILDQTDNGAPEVYNINELTLEGNNTCGFRHDPTNSASQAILNAGLIGKVDSFTGTKGIEVLNGIVDAIVNNIIADDAIIVSNSSTLDIVSDHVVGNITVDAGCTLNCEILDFTGTLTNNGTIIGRIGSSNFGIGGQVDSVGGGTNINISGTAVDPIVNLDAAVTGLSVNGVSLTDAGASTNFLDETGNYSSPVGGGTLQDAYDNGQNITTTTALGPVVLNNTGSTRAALTITPGTVPTTSLVSGQVYSDGNDLYIYDSVRGKFLSGSERFGFGLNSAGDNEYMRVGHASDTNAAWVIPYDATITHITAFVTGGQADKGFEIQDVSGTVLASFNLVTSEFDGTQNVDIPAGTHLRAFIVAAGGSVSNSAVSVFIRRRV